MTLLGSMQSKNWWWVVRGYRRGSTRVVPSVGVNRLDEYYRDMSINVQYVTEHVGRDQFHVSTKRRSVQQCYHIPSVSNAIYATPAKIHSLKAFELYLRPRNAATISSASSNPPFSSISRR